MTAKYHFQIKDIGISSKNFNGLNLGRMIEYRHKFEAFKLRASSTRMNMKQISFAKGLKEFKKDYNVDEFYVINDTRPDWKSDSCEIWYTTKD